MTSSTETPATAIKERIPDFFIAGNPKSGTTALYEMLRTHPQIYMPELKEPWFLADDMRPRFQSPLSGPLPQTLSEYLALFADAPPGTRVGEASSSYLWSRTAAEAIARLSPGARIIAILREPASFLRSLHLQLLQTHVESHRDLRRAMALEPARSAGRRIPRRCHRPQLLRYSEHVRYVEQLRRFEQLFPPAQMLVLIYDDFRDDNAGTVERVRRFLGVDEQAPIEVLHANPTVMTRSQQLDDMVHAVSVGRGPVSNAVKGVLKAALPTDLRRSMLSYAQRRIVHGRPAPVDESLDRELRKRFRGEVVALSEHLDRDLISLWGYE